MLIHFEVQSYAYFMYNFCVSINSNNGQLTMTTASYLDQCSKVRGLFVVWVFEDLPFYRVSQNTVVSRRQRLLYFWHKLKADLFIKVTNLTLQSLRAHSYFYFHVSFEKNSSSKAPSPQKLLCASVL